jgi:hypothetical protein
MRREHEDGEKEAKRDIDHDPALKAANGLAPAPASSRNRVVRPMLKKQKMKAQVRKSLSGPTNVGTTNLL